MYVVEHPQETGEVFLLAGASLLTCGAVGVE